VLSFVCVKRRVLRGRQRVEYIIQVWALSQLPAASEPYCTQLNTLTLAIPEVNWSVENSHRGLRMAAGGHTADVLSAARHELGLATLSLPAVDLLLRILSHTCARKYQRVGSCPHVRLGSSVGSTRLANQLSSVDAVATKSGRADAKTIPRPNTSHYIFHKLVFLTAEPSQWHRISQHPTTFLSVI
jgi:hypothetical protein